MLSAVEEAVAVVVGKVFVGWVVVGIEEEEVEGGPGTAESLLLGGCMVVWRSGRFALLSRGSIYLKSVENLRSIC